MNNKGQESQTAYSALSAELGPCTHCAPRINLLFSDSHPRTEAALLLLPEIEMQNKPRERGLSMLQMGVWPGTLSQLRLGCIFLERPEKSTP